MKLRCGARELDLTRARVMGVLNLTPDSFYDGGRLWRDGRVDVEAALRRAREMADEGAAVIDVGAESTRPGAAPVGEQEEIDRALPVVEKIAAELPAVISVDTSSPALMRAAAAAGAGMINDVRALRRPEAAAAAAAANLPVCLMHMRGEPGDMQDAPRYDDVVAEVREFLLERRRACEEAGVDAGRLIFDPGFGFGKSPEHNLRLIAELDSLVACGQPVLIGVSRKSTIGAALGRETEARLPGSLALAAAAVMRGALLVRAHDVAATADALAMLEALRRPDKIGAPR